ncbi:hypothetical protein HJFPF1_09626 [Paramyrothecium foliicola]|nr:hypothetical protein HJFPF1_09626 [Paramyrothecium foliicola]
MVSKLSGNDPAFDADTDASTAASTVMTPYTDLTAVDDAWHGHAYAVPWPGSTYIIVEHGGDAAITVTNQGVRLRDMKDDNNANNRWQCVEKNGYFGFYNQNTRTYLGHNGKDRIVQGRVHDRWEYITPRKHPDGGYQLLFPFWEHTLLVLSIDGDGKSLLRTRHGQNRWDFLKV